MKVMKNRVFNLIVLATAELFVLAGTALSQPLSQQLGPGAYVKYRPGGSEFTATIVKTYKINGKVWLQEHITHSSKRDRSTSRSLRRFTEDGQMVVNNTILRDPSRHREIYVEHFTQSTHHSDLPPRAHAPAAAAPVASLAMEVSTLLGYQVYRIETERSPSPDGEFVEESWIAPELDNFPLRVVAKETSDGTTRLWETQVTSVIPAALPQEAFEVPPGYTERTPSEVTELVHDRFGKPPIPPSQTSVWDRRYFRRLPASMQSLVRSRPAADTSRLAGRRGKGGLASTRATEIEIGIGEEFKTGPSHNSSGSGLSHWSRLLAVAVCLIVVAGVLLMRRNYLRDRVDRN